MIVFPPSSVLFAVLYLLCGATDVLDGFVTGLLLFLLPLSVCVADVKYTATLVCAVATVTVIKEMANQKEDYTL